MERVYISVCGEGFGHSSRALAVAEELKKKGCDVFLGSYGYVYNYLKSQNLCKVIKIPKEWEMKGEKGKFSVGKTFLSTMKIILTKYRTLINKEKEIMKKKRINCVISDGRISPIIAGSYHLGLPLLFMTNMTTIRKRFLHKVERYLLSPPMNFLGKAGVVLLDEIVIPDFPPPNDICHYLLAKKSNVKKRTSFVGPLVRKNLYESKPIKKKKKTVLAVVGGHEYRRPLLECVVKTARLCKDMDFIIISRLIKRKKVEGNVKLLPFVKNLYPYMRASDFIITQSGHSTVMEMLSCGKTGILIPDEGQYEQEAIARRAKELKLFEKVTHNRLSPKTLMKKIDILLNDKSYRRNTQKLSKTAKKLNGSKKVAEMAIDYSSRMTMKY